MPSTAIIVDGTGRAALRGTCCIYGAIGQGWIGMGFPSFGEVVREHQGLRIGKDRSRFHPYRSKDWQQ